MPTGVSRSSRGGQTWVWRHSVLACLLSQRGMVAGTPVGWGGDPSRVWALPGPRPGDPESVSQGQQPFPFRDLGGAGWAPEPQAWLEDSRAEGTSGGQGSAGLRPWDLVYFCLLLSLCPLVGSLTLSFSVSG